MFGIIIFAGGLYFYKDSKRQDDTAFAYLAIVLMLLGLFLAGDCAIYNKYLINYVDSNKNNLVSIYAIDEDNNITNKSNDEVVMKFKEPDNSIKEIRASVKERFTKDKRKCNKYSLKNIENGYVIYYISEDMHAPRKLAPKYVDKMKTLDNVVKE